MILPLIWGNSIRLRNMAPADTVFVSESGIKTAEDIRILYENQIRLELQS